MIPYGAIPKTTINVTIKTGNIHEQEDQVWLSDLMADLMEEGSTTQNTKTIANKMASMGGNLNISVGVHTMTLSTNVLSEFAPDAIAIIADVLQNPSWPSEELDRLKNDMKRSVQASVYPNHPYGRIYPSIEQIESYSVNSIKSFYNSNIGGKRTTVYIVGKFNKNEVENAVTDAFENWIEGPDEFYPVAQAITENKVKIIDRPGAPQSTIYFGLPVADPSDPDYTALDVTNSILGGSFGSRITSNIREDKGYTYSPRSVLATNYKTGLWYEVADVTTEFTGASLDEIKKEIYRLQNEAPSDEELDGIKNYQTGIYVLQNSTPGGIIGQLNFLDIHELEDSYLINRVQNLLAVSPQDVQEMTKKYINPEKMTLIVVGDKVKIEKQIEETLKEKIKQ
jgi:predicted Zn-dependent peptidase